MQPFPTVGIGTSAGGLSALEKFFRAVPVGTGMAFVVVQHLDPRHKGMLPELLQRATPMPVSVAVSGMTVRRDCVYVIPPNRDMTIRDGKLQLSKLAKSSRGLSLPIDRFFSSLADNSRQLAIGIVLSGMGMDGTRGCRDIRARGGFVGVQDPRSAEFDSMPRSVIDSKHMDAVAPVEELPARILARHHDVVEAGGSSPDLDIAVRGDMGRLITLLRVRTGHDFSLYKKATLQRRIERRMRVHQFETAERYLQFLRDNPQELDLLFQEMLIGVTNFFRDPAAWNHLRDQVIPALMKRHPQGQALRAWVAGCSSGEEAYTLAIAFRQALAKSKSTAPYSLQIFATDLDSDAIEAARAGVYPASIAKDVGVERLSRYFTQEGNRYRINTEIREMVTFAVQDVIHDPAFTRLDILTCRNLFIYFETELQKKVLALFHYSLNPAGILFLGHAETIGHATNLFRQMKSKLPLYERQQGHSTSPMEFPNARLRLMNIPAVETARPAAKLQTLAEQLLLQRFSPTAVLVNGDGDVLYISGRSGEYLEPAAGKANWNIHAMIRDDLRIEVSGLIDKSLRQKAEFSCIVQRGPKKKRAAVEIAVRFLDRPLELRGMLLITFAASQPPVEGKRSKEPLSVRRSVELHEALRHAHEENRSIRENVSTTEEELKSANEELQSTNEELQSTNEELTTSKEEMQSMNEELGTVNAELQARVDELTRATSDMKNLLDSTALLAVFLDARLRVRLFTDSATRIFRLIASDVGRPLTDIVSDLSYPDLQDDAGQVLRTLVFSDKQVVTRDGRRFRVKIMPYRTLANVIDGVVITCTATGPESGDAEVSPQDP